MSDFPAAWYHCNRCGTLFKAAGTGDQRGDCPSCGDPVTGGEAEVPAPVRIRRKVRKPRKSSTPGRRREGKKQARALMILVILWTFGLGMSAIWLKRRWQGGPTPSVIDDSASRSLQARADQRLLQDQLDACARRLGEFLVASDIGGRSQHVLHPERTVQRMARHQQFDPIFPSNSPLALESSLVIHTPVGPAIETLWKQDDGHRVEAVFFEDDGEWKIDWDAHVRLGTEPWALFLAGQGTGQGDFRLLARERIGANGRDTEFLGLVLYTTRPGYPGQPISPSPEIRVERGTGVGRKIEEAFAARKKDLGPYGSRAMAHDPDEMIRLRVRVTREGEDERIFRITELLATHWMELAPANPEPE